LRRTQTATKKTPVAGVGVAPGKPGGKINS
jgi:hypothetical protein